MGFVQVPEEGAFSKKPFEGKLKEGEGNKGLHTSVLSTAITEWVFSFVCGCEQKQTL